MRTALRDRYDELRDQIHAVRAAAPPITLTTIVVAIVFAAGVAAGWHVSQPFTRRAVNAEWRANLAASAAEIRSLLKQADVDADAADAKIIAKIGEINDLLAKAERALKDASRRPADPRCPGIPVECLQ